MNESLIADFLVRQSDTGCCCTSQAVSPLQNIAYPAVVLHSLYSRAHSHEDLSLVLDETIPATVYQHQLRYSLYIIRRMKRMILIGWEDLCFVSMEDPPPFPPLFFW